MDNLKCIGLMSGTSMDGIDAALIETDGKAQINHIAATSIEYDVNFKILLKSAEYSVKKCNGNLELAKKIYPNDLIEYLKSIYKDIAPILSALSEHIHANKEKPISLEDIILHSTHLHADVVTKLLGKAKLKAEDIDVIGYHGQTLYHNPHREMTIQVGYGQLLADILGITVVNNFRENDVKNGGQGAPLAPLYHQALSLRDALYPVCIVNCGGIANITIINGKNKEDLIGFDTGPGNVLIDRFIRNRTSNKETFDKDGKYGLQGRVNDDVLNALYKHSTILDGVNFFEIAPPKSLDSGDCNLISELEILNFEDACATLEAFTAYTIADSLKFTSPPYPQKILLAGGGWNNPVITLKLKEYTQKKSTQQIDIMKVSEIGWSSQYLEAETFAFLAARSLIGLPISSSNVTNAQGSCLGGRAYMPLNKKITKSVNQLLERNPAVLSGYMDK